jgi:hypothetical protein
LPSLHPQASRFRSISVPAEHLGLPEKASTHSNTDPEATKLDRFHLILILNTAKIA